MPTPQKTLCRRTRAPAVSAQAFKALLKPCAGQRPLIDRLSPAQFRELLAHYHTPLRNTFCSAFDFWIGMFEEQAEWFDSPVDGIAYANTFLANIRSLRLGHHNFADPVSFVETVAHDYAAVLVALTLF